MSLLPLTAPEVRRLLLALAEPPERFNFRLAWSRWRRHHQAVAKRGHVARRARRPVVLPPASLVPAPMPEGRCTALTDALWQRVVPLLPPQQPPHGRSNLDHRRMVAAMLFVERTGCSWRALPSHFGHWSTIHSRYQRWRKAGLWSAICAILDQSDAEQAAA